MKRFFLSAAALLLGLSAVFSQELQTLPDDPAVRKGTLENGMTYYIRHNDKPEQRAEFYLATNVGAIQEAPDQDGLAHFLEHMCFNGTQNFPGKSLLNWLESIGASFGGNVNASTGVEQTEYMLNNIPLVRESVIDTCLLIMHDYSHFVSCDPQEIDAERGVILEERRTRNDAAWRLNEKAMPFYFGDTKYATCTIIGSEENLKTFRPESLTDFYHTWYRPDLQALVVVGDVDVDAVEAKIKATFADIPAAVNPRPKDIINIPDNVEPIVGIITDPEASSTSVELLWKSQAKPLEYNNTVTGYTIDIIRRLTSMVMSERFETICGKPGAPFIDAGLAVGNMCMTMDVVMATAVVRDGEALSGFKALLTEIEKMKRFGFTEAELDRAKAELLSVMESAANRAESRKNSEFVPELLYNFFYNYPYMDPAVEYQVIETIFAQLPAEVINSAAAQMITEENLVLLYTAPEKEGLTHPTEDELLSVLKEVEDIELEVPEEDRVSAEFLKPSKLLSSKVRKIESTVYGATEWTLRNGLTVILYPTDFEKDRISFLLYREGGESLIEDEDLPSFEANLQSLYHSFNGVSRYNSVVLDKMLAGKQLAVEPRIGSLNTGIAGYSTVKDLETAFQLIHLYYVEPRFDKNAFEQAVTNLRSLLPNYLATPDAQFQKELSGTLYDHNPRQFFIDESVLDRASLATIKRVTKALYKDVAGARMIITGDFDMDEIKPLVERYLGSLPKGRKAPKWIDRNTDITKRAVTNDFKVRMQTPKATVCQILRRDDSYSIERTVSYSALNYILDMLYTETLREEEGGTYGASVSLSLSRIPKPVGVLFIGYDTDPESADRLRALALDGIRKIAEEGPSAEQFDKTLKNLQKQLPEAKITNSFWINALKTWYDEGVDYVSEYEAAVNSLTAEKVRSLAADFIRDSNLIEVIMRPAADSE